jgi:hypothetical protein
VYVYDAPRAVLSLFGDEATVSVPDWHNSFTETGVRGHTAVIAHTTREPSVALLAPGGLAARRFAHAHRG